MLVFEILFKFLNFVLSFLDLAVPEFSYLAIVSGPFSLIGLKLERLYLFEFGINGIN